MPSTGCDRVKIEPHRGPKGESLLVFVVTVALFRQSILQQQLDDFDEVIGWLKLALQYDYWTREIAEAMSRQRVPGKLVR